MRDSPVIGDFHDGGLLRPGIQRAVGLTDDAALLRAIVDVEAAWLAVLGHDAELQVPTDVAALAAAGERVGNPVVPILDVLRSQTHSPVHRGLTSQDTLDTALMLIAVRARRRILADVRALTLDLARLADGHRDSLMVGRTLTQTAVPITFGLKVAQWLAAILDAAEAIASVDLPVQCGGAAGTMSLIQEMTDAEQAPAALAANFGLSDPGLPWHTRRRPVTAMADALATLTDALGTMASDIALLSRPEIGELSEGSGGGSSTMPHKHNPVLSVLIRSASLQVPPLAAGLHTAASQMIDERPDGAWHAQWPLFRDVLTLAVIAAGQSRDLIAGLVVHEDVMRRRADGVASDLLAEKYGADGVPADADPTRYLGRAATFTDTVTARVGRPPRLAFTPLAGSSQDPCVLIVGAGLGTSAAPLWREVAHGLTGVQVVAVDLPGHGASPPAERPFSVAELAGEVRDEAARLATPGRRVWFAGVSLAGAVALEIALRPGPIEGVVSIASASRLGVPAGWRERAALVRRAGTSATVAGSAERWFAAGFTERQPQLVGAMLDDLVVVDDESYALCCEALADYDLAQELGAAAVPVLMLPGDMDVVVPVAVAEADANGVPDGAVRVAKGAGHQPPVEAPTAVIDCLREFMGVRGD